MEKIPESEAEQLPDPTTNRDEQIRYFDAHPERIRKEYLNNFHLWIPGSEHLHMLRKYMRDTDKRREQAVIDALNAMPEVQKLLEEEKKAEDERRSKEEKGKESYARDLERINEILIPVYLRLRKEGFSHYDLVR